MIRAISLAFALVAVPWAASAHGLVVFASTDCELVHVEAKFSNGKPVKKGAVEVRGGENQLLRTLSVEEGAAQVPLEGLDYSGGLLILIDTDGHDDYWILTPEDIARKCGS